MTVSPPSAPTNNNNHGENSHNVNSSPHCSSTPTQQGCQGQARWHRTPREGQGQGSGVHHRYGDWGWRHYTQASCQPTMCCNFSWLKKFAFLGLLLVFVIPCLAWKLIPLLIAFKCLSKATSGHHPRPIRPLLFSFGVGLLFFPCFRWIVFGLFFILFKLFWLSCTLYGIWSFFCCVCKWKRIDCRCDRLMEHFDSVQRCFRQCEEMYRLLNPVINNGSSEPRHNNINNNTGCSPTQNLCQQNDPTQRQQQPSETFPSRSMPSDLSRKQHNTQKQSHRQQSTPTESQLKMDHTLQSPSGTQTSSSPQQMYPTLPPYSPYSYSDTESNQRVKID